MENYVFSTEADLNSKIWREEGEGDDNHRQRLRQLLPLLSLFSLMSIGIIAKLRGKITQ